MFALSIRVVNGPWERDMLTFNAFCFPLFILRKQYIFSSSSSFHTRVYQSPFWYQIFFIFIPEAKAFTSKMNCFTQDSLVALVWLLCPFSTVRPIHPTSKPSLLQAAACHYSGQHRISQTRCAIHRDLLPCCSGAKELLKEIDRSCPCPRRSTVPKNRLDLASLAAQVTFDRWEAAVFNH